MIISDKYKFCFVHIPKCAGTYLREKLQPLDDYERYFADVKAHDTLKKLDYGHIPLFILKAYFPTEYQKVQAYWSFSLVRDPYKRFPSSLSQRLKWYSDTPMHQIGTKALIRSIDGTINFLSSHNPSGTLLPHDYIHFQRQVDYIYVEDKQIISSLYSVNDMQHFQNQFNEKTQLALNFSNEDKTQRQVVVSRNALLQQAINVTRPLTSLITNRFSEKMKDKIRSKVYVPRDKRFKEIFDSQHIKDFVTDYYQKDIEMFEKLDTGRA